MIFLMEYDRPAGKLITLRPFESSQKLAAQDAKLDLELDLHRRGTQHEIVLLEAESEDALRHGYRRYFEDLPDLAQAAIDGLKAMERH
jgi:hypothetical protein